MGAPKTLRGFDRLYSAARQARDAAANMPDGTLTERIARHEALIAAHQQLKTLYAQARETIRIPATGGYLDSLAWNALWAAWEAQVARVHKLQNELAELLAAAGESR